MLVNELPNNVLMYWRVRGVSNDGYGEWSDVWNFTTAGNAPVLISPSNGLTNVKIPLKFSWDPFNNAINYKFQLSNNETFDNIIAGANDIAINQYNITTYILEPSTSYYWHVQANLNGAESNWSQTWSFTTDPVISVNDIAEIAPELSVVPNPVNESTQINFKLSNPSNTTITILDMAGRIVFKKDLGYLTAGNNYFVWQPEILSNGKYFIQINYNSHQINGELILNR